MLASEGGHIQCVEMLIRSDSEGGAVNSYDKDLMYAAEGGHTACVDLLISVEFGHTHCVDLLFEKGADVKAVDSPL